uniref:Uncharacterized protein n=1 Tax=Avena sativa TaxID=4498 RepID=A0ACD5TM60_AVESA
MAAADEKAKQTEEASNCSLYGCFCCWRRACSLQIPRVAPRQRVPLHTGRVLGLHRFRVARSGRVLGRSDDALEILHTFRTASGCDAIASAAAALTPDGSSLCLFSEHLEPGKISAIPRAQKLRLTYGNVRDAAVMSPELPRLPPECPMKCRPVSAAGQLWATNIKLEVRTSKCFVGMLRLDTDADRWKKAGDTFALPLRREELINPRWGGPLFQGCAVLHDDTILVSLRADQGLVTFNCDDCAWTEVTTTTKDTHLPYIPILGRGVFIKEDATEEEEEDGDYDGAVYFLRDNHVFAYKLCYYQVQDQEDQRRKLKLEPPVMIDAVCPFREEGYGFLTHLAGRLMCSVWISTWPRCSCDYNLHVLITTFRVRSTSAEQKGIDILHSTCRRLDVFPLGQPIHEFSFLQGLLAYELVQQGNNHKELSDPIFLQFSWKFSRGRSWAAERMCLDCADKAKNPDAIVFCVVQGEYCYSKSLPCGNSTSHDVHITTIRVKTERARREHLWVIMKLNSPNNSGYMEDLRSPKAQILCMDAAIQQTEYKGNDEK